MNATRNAIVLVAAILIAPLAGCDDETAGEEFGDLQVTYRIGSGSNSCEDVGITFVRIHVQISETVDQVDEIYPCTPASQSVLLTDVAVGTYTLRVEGLDSENAVIYSGTATEEFTVEADHTNGPVSVTLNQLRPAIQIWVGFAEPGGCSRAEVTEVVLRLYENGASLVYDETFGCEDRIAEALLIEDLSETSTYDLRVRGTNDNSEYTYDYDEDAIAVAPGAPTEVSAELEQCTGLCSEP